MNRILNEIEKKFRESFREEPLLVRSPGRVNLIGEHTDYNEGFVLPAAINKAIYFAVSPRHDGQCVMHASDLEETYTCEVSHMRKSEKGWPNYLMGVVDQFEKAGYRIPGFNVVFGGDIPIASGLSSSAALEAGLAYALNHMFHLQIDKIDLVKFAQRAENQFVGVQCGIMDQLINIYGAQKKVLKLDCRSLEHEYYPFEREDLRVVLCDTQVSRELASSEYNQRRSQCEAGVRILQQYNNNITSLRDVSMEMLELYQEDFDPVIYKRCEYVIKENERVLAACNDLKAGDFSRFGSRMFESHAGLRDEYEVSCRELDILVDIAAGTDGVLGSRMMGAGFGGCTINLVEDDKVEDFRRKVSEEYRQKTGRELKIYLAQIDAGTREIVGNEAELV